MKKNLLLAVFSLLIALVIAEIVLRCVGIERVKFQEKTRLSWVKVPENIWIEHHPVLGWYPQKNKIATLTSDQFSPVSVHTNSAGFRGLREYSRSKPAGTIRIAALGDSFVFGFGVQDAESFSAILESQASGREVLNLGVPGYGIDQIFLSYREIAKDYQPDIVLIGIFPEDFWRATRSFADSGHVKPYFSLAVDGKLQPHNIPVPPPFSQTADQYPTIVAQTIFEKLLNGSVLYRVAKRPLIKLAKNMRLIDPDSTDEWIVGRAILKQMIQEVRQNDSTPILVLIPPQDWVQSSRKTSLEKSIIRFAGREKVRLINLKPAFTEAVAKNGLETYYIKNDWHWTPKGHQLAAEIINQDT